MAIVKYLIIFSLIFSSQLMATEEPEFTLILKDNHFEIREYAPRIMAQVSTSGDFDEASSGGFKVLADYIFGENIIKDRAEKISMTAPVLAEKNNNEWLISFVMPRKYSMETLPKPISLDVRLTEAPKEKFAVIVFSGLVRESNYNEKFQLLNEFIKDKGLISLEVLQVARYNPPWTLPFFRWNELLIKIQ